jgi:hypothetical protein
MAEGQVPETLPGTDDLHVRDVASLQVPGLQLLWPGLVGR